mmetsp:Transcript_55877/g.164102  ORF Transcript_55877/g.164102 Transcript_55877/m.164102 type:complete len:212 (+) Transcript_55877:90-725(+)
MEVACTLHRVPPKRPLPRPPAHNRGLERRQDAATRPAHASWAARLALGPLRGRRLPWVQAGPRPATAVPAGGACPFARPAPRPPATAPPGPGRKRRPRAPSARRALRGHEWPARGSAEAAAAGAWARAARPSARGSARGWGVRLRAAPGWPPAGRPPRPGCPRRAPRRRRPRGGSAAGRCRAPSGGRGAPPGRSASAAAPSSSARGRPGGM